MAQPKPTAIENMEAHREAAWLEFCRRCPEWQMTVKDRTCYMAGWDAAMLQAAEAIRVAAVVGPKLCACTNQQLLAEIERRGGIHGTPERPIT